MIPHSCRACGYLTRDLTVLSRDFAVKSIPILVGSDEAQNQPNLLQIRRISEHLKKKNKKQKTKQNKTKQQQQQQKTKQ